MTTALRHSYHIQHTYRAETNHISITSLMHNLYWLPIETRIRFKLCILMHDAIDYDTPTYNRQWINMVERRISLRMRHTFRLKSHHNHENGRTTINEHAIHTWNRLHDYIRTITFKVEFKSRLNAPLRNLILSLLCCFTLLLTFYV